MHVFVSGGCQLCSLLYPVRQLQHICRVYAEEDVQDFRQLRPGLDLHQIVVLFLCTERALHHCCAHLGKFLSNKSEFSAIAWSGSSFFTLPNSLFSHFDI
ncbi:MAG: hypothetical protein PUH91_00465 [Prevotella sp.]|nr:hypothetical protein [Prevotella sp.]